MFSQKINEMATVANKGMHDSNLNVELELRIACNVLINFLIYNNDD